MNNNIDLILCFDFKTQSKFAEQIKYPTNMSKIPWLIPTRCASEMENKQYFNQWMIKNNFSQYMPLNKSISDYPYVLKIGNGYSAKYVHLIKNFTDLQNLNINFLQNQYICQEYIQGAFEYAFHFIALNGNIIKHVTYKHIFSEKATNGWYIKGRGFFNKQIQKIVLEKAHYAVIADIINKCKFDGIGCIDFKILDGRLFIFEFNSRMGGSVLYFDHILHDLDDFLLTLRQIVLSFKHQL